ncbi:uncharacterized protein [Triticum aestivum]|uniref:uncharacterized protein n=1 Tax=Triticum aestivum TaxID=4565 RepID=UPI001D0045F0|nr:uncharacterized protein LOC123156428 [Triticum aestivum]
MISMRCTGEATEVLVVDASAVFHRHAAAPSNAALPHDDRPVCRSAGTEPRARRCHGHGGLQGEADTHTASSCSLCLTASLCSTATSTDAHTGLYEALELRDGGSNYLGKGVSKVWQHRRVDNEGGDRSGERRELVAAGLDNTSHICAFD